MPFSSVITRLLGLWVLFGGVLKLLYGSPADLPEMIRDLPLRIGLTFKLAIALELIVGALALLRPTRGWIPALLLNLLFLVVLSIQVAAGEESCGCFGAAITISPLVMLAIDGVLLLLLLLSKPWRMGAARFQAPWLLVALALALGGALPWILDREATSVDDVGPGGFTKIIYIDAESLRGKRFDETPLYALLSEEQRFEDGVVVVWRASCEVCATHLSILGGQERGERPVVLFELPKEFEDEENKVHTLPMGAWVHEIRLKTGVTWWVTPPAHYVIEKGVITTAKEGMDVLR